MIYHRINDIYFGFAELKINDIWRHFRRFFEDFSMLITCLDSSPDLLELKKWIEYISSRKWGHRVIGQSIWIPADSVQKVFEEEKTFYHFDEIYLLESAPTAIDDSSHFTTDGSTFEDEIPVEFIEKFAKLGAVRYLSDGCGLNFGCESLEIVRKIQEIEKIVGGHYT